MSRPYRPFRKRQGITAVMAMLYMVLFATMALGFYSTVTTAVALAKNDQKSSRAMLAAESGIQFMRYHLAHVAIPPLTVESSAVMQDLFNDLNDRLQNTGNLKLGAYTVGISSDSKLISIPEQPGAFITTDATNNSGFRIEIKEQAGNIICRVMGRTGNGGYVSARGVSLDFARQPIESTLFENAIAARSSVVIKNGTMGGVGGVPNTIASILSAQESGVSVRMTGGTVGGDLGIIQGASANISGGSVHGTSSLTNIYKNYLKTHPEAPEFPVIDTDTYSQYATNPYVAGQTVYKNVRIPAGENPKFAGGTTIQGIMYVESPNVIDFNGDTNMQGFIVWDNGGTSATNKINMFGNFSHSKLEDSAEWGELATITGVAVLAPNTAVVMSGSTASQIQGNMIVGRFENAGANTITFDQGSLIAMDPTGDSIIINTAKDLRWTSTGFNNQPSKGPSYSTYYDPVPGSYQELSQ